MQADHTGRMLIRIEKILLKEMPKVILVQGDTNTVLAGALTVSKLLTTRDYTHIDMHIGHIEAGLRSYDRSMPEEINRFITDHFSDFLFAPTRLAADTLVKEGVPKKRVYMTGNTIVDAVFQNLKLARKNPKILNALGLSEDEDYFLLTLHRQENVDNPERLRRILKGIEAIGRHFGKKIIFPIHPRTVKKLKSFKVRVSERVQLVPPMGFLEFLLLESKAKLILTDSGGIQEEACILKVPCVTLRTTTERPETVRVGGNMIAGFEPNSILRCAKKMITKKGRWANPFGDGQSSARIIRIIEKNIS